MCSITYQYEAVTVRQTPTSKPMVMFSAPAVEIISWGGIPQKKRQDDHETLGFQRGENKKRVDEIGVFCDELDNVIQNPLLCARRKYNGFSAEFNLQEGSSSWGTLEIKSPDFSQMSLLEIMELVLSGIEERVPELKEQRLNTDKVNKLKRALGIADIELDADEPEDEFDEEQDGDESAMNDDEDIKSVLLEEETHIVDFWEEVACRVQVLKDSKDACIENEILGFSREAMISMLQPIMIVDGQHRLLGSIQSANDIVVRDHKEEFAQKIIELGDPDKAKRELMRKYSRRLPVALLLNDDPAEHVFQFVVVNQKATPMGKALLGTIVSTTLSSGELDRISARLEKSGIPLEESRAITAMIRKSDSPFFNLVERGTLGENKNLLKWNVLGGLINIFRNLKGGKLFHENIDYADRWREYCLENSEIVSGWKEMGFENALDYWQSLDGPWRDVFIKFWAKVKDTFSTPPSVVYSAWGNPRESNLFNKISLTILTSDFFQYLSDKELPINTSEDIPKYVDEWLEKVDKDYFNRDWILGGVKKDSTGIRKQWSKIWTEYRKYPKSLPYVNSYRKPMP